MDEWMQSADGPEATDQPSTSEEVPAALPDTGEPTVTTDVLVTPPGNSDESNEEVNQPMETSGLLARRQAAKPSSPEVRSVNSIDMPNRGNEVEMGNHLEQQRTHTESPESVETRHCWRRTIDT